MSCRSETWTIPRCPCKGCDNRTITCHCTCGQYAEWKAYRERINAKKQLEQTSHTDKHQMPFWREKARLEKVRRNGG